MNLISDHPFWTVRNGLVASYPALPGDRRCDVAVVGGGITGALVAFHLADAGVRVVLVDRRDIGTGSTSGSTGLLQYEVDVPLRCLARQIGPERALRSYRLCHEALHKLGALIGRLHIDCGFRLRPSLYLARHACEIPELREELRWRRNLGLAVEFWDQTAIAQRFPFSRPAALFSRSGGEVDPHLLCHGLLAAAQRRGAEVFDRTCVEQFVPGRRGIQLRIQGGYTIHARHAVIAAGFEAKTYLRTNVGRLKSTYALISEPVADFKQWHQRCLIWETGLPYLYLRTTADQRIIVGGEDEDFVNPKRRDRLITAKTLTLVKKFHRLFPDLALDVAYAWAGTFGETPDGLAYIGRHRSLPHASFALGYGGNGITYSLIAAELIRDDFLGRRNRDAPIFSFDRRSFQPGHE